MYASSKKSHSCANKVHMDVRARKPHYGGGQHPRRALSVVSRLAPAYTQAAQQVALLPILPACRRLVGNTCGSAPQALSQQASTLSGTPST